MLQINLNKSKKIKLTFKKRKNTLKYIINLSLNQNNNYQWPLNDRNLDFQSGINDQVDHVMISSSERSQLIFQNKEIKF